MRPDWQPSLRNATALLQPPSHAPVPNVDRLAEHEGAAPDDAIDASCLALANGLFRHAPFPKGTVKPHPAYATLCALPHQFHRNSWVGSDHDTIDQPRYGADVRIAAYAFNFGSLRVDWEHFVARVVQLAVDSVGRLTGVPRDASHCNPLSAKEPGH
jgi:hypothetical protein